MKKLLTTKVLLLICVTLFFVVSIVSIYSSRSILSVNYSNYYQKQLIWYAIGVGLFIFCLSVGTEKVLRYSSLFYFASIVLLIIVLFFGNEVNNTRGWISFGGLNFQPSEFAKVGLILYLSKLINDFHFQENKTTKEELKLIGKIVLATFIPSILVFLEPDTGAVIIYLFIALSMIFISPIRTRWVLILIGTFILLVSSFVILYYYYPQAIIDFFGNDFYYRIFRIIDWKASSGIQLENSLIAIGTSGIYGYGINNTPVYFPEPYTDFIFTIWASNFGVFLAIVLIILIFVFDFLIIKIASKSNSTLYKYIIFGIFSAFIFSQIQNIAMTLGILPIMGIPLPFISYGGSSIFINFFMLFFVIGTKKFS